MSKIEIEIPEGKRPEWVNGVLTLVDDKPQDITERIKTFEDACKWCNHNDKGYLIDQYIAMLNAYNGSTKDVTATDLLAYLKLRIITCALNEGWEPDFWNEAEYKYWAWMYTLTEDEYNCIDEDEKKERTCRVVGRANNNANAYGGLVYSNAYYVSSFSYTSHGSRLAFKSRELAVYAVKQFKEIFAEYLF